MNSRDGIQEQFNHLLTQANRPIRIRIGGEMIPDDGFAERYFRVHDRATLLVERGELPGLPSYLETMTAIAFLT